VHRQHQALRAQAPRCLPPCLCSTGLTGGRSRGSHSAAAWPC
jgi:hypothetical protein